MKFIRYSTAFFAAITILILSLIGCKEDCIKSDNCSLEPETGMCMAAFPRYYYDKEEKECKEFTWGGCGGVVPFDSLEECKSACVCSD
jgi:hypothetical protein